MSINVWAPAHWWSPFLRNRVCQNVSPRHSRCLFCCPVMDIVPPQLFSQDVPHTHTHRWSLEAFQLAWHSWALSEMPQTSQPEPQRSNITVLMLFLERRVCFAALLDNRPCSGSLVLTVCADRLAPACCPPPARSALVALWSDSRIGWRRQSWGVLLRNLKPPSQPPDLGDLLNGWYCFQSRILPQLSCRRISSRALTYTLSCFEGEMIDMMSACSLAEGPKCRKTVFLWDKWHFCGHLTTLPSTLEHIQISVLIKLRKLSSSKLQASAVWQNSDEFLLN